MDKMTFAQKVAEEVNGTVKVIEKANGVKAVGVMLPATDGVSPIAYIDDAYDSGKAIEEVVEMIEGIKTPEIKYLFDIKDYEQAKGRIKCRLYNKKTKAEVYTSAKRYGFDDLILVPYVEGVIENGSVKVTKQLLEMWGKTKAEIIKLGMANIEPRIMPFPIPGAPFKIVSNDDLNYGAASVIKAKRELKKWYPNGYTIIPSSVHEVLVMDNKDVAETEGLIDIVKSINQSDVVSETDFLADNVYTFV